MLMLGSMTLDLMEGHIGSAKAKKSVNIHFSNLPTQEQKMSVFLTKTPQVIRKRCFMLEKSHKSQEK